MSDQACLETRLRDLEARYEGLLQAAVEGIIVIDARGVIEVFSAGAERIFGYAAAEVLGHNVSQLMPEPDAGQHDAYLSNFQRTRQARIIGMGREVEGRRKSGATFPMELAVGEVHIQAGVRYVGIARDISRRKSIELALQSREEELRLIAAHAPIGIITANLGGLVTSCNLALAELLQTPAEELRGVPVATLVEVCDRPRMEAALRRVVSEGGHQREPDLRVRAGNDRPLRIVVAHLGLVTRGGDPHRIVVQLVDRTQELDAQESAARMQAEMAHVARLTTLGEMASAISHEINQPLTAIATQAQAFRRLMQTEQAIRDEVAAGLESIAEQALRVGQVVKRVRAFVTKRETARELLDVNELVGQVLDLARVDARKGHVRLEVTFGADLPGVIGDSVQLQQVVLNLVRNAIDASQDIPVEQREVTLATAAREGGVRLTVADRGSGVPPELEEKLFQPFFTTKADGVGMGLSISHSLVEAHGGTLRHQANPDGGALFEMTLPGLPPDGAREDGGA